MLHQAEADGIDLQALREFAPFAKQRLDSGAHCSSSWPSGTPRQRHQGDSRILPVDTVLFRRPGYEHEFAGDLI